MPRATPKSPLTTTTPDGAEKLGKRTAAHDLGCAVSVGVGTLRDGAKGVIGAKGRDESIEARREEAWDCAARRSSAIWRRCARECGELGLALDDGKDKLLRGCELVGDKCCTEPCKTCRAIRRQYRV